MKTRSRGLGWKPDLPDARDYRLRVEAPAVLPASVDLRIGCPPVYDQGYLGSCTANAVAAALEFDQRLQRLPEFVPSRLFIYYNERVIEDSVSEDAGAELRDGMKAVAKLGAGSEIYWPYDVAKFAIKPGTKIYKDAKKHPAVIYQRLEASQGRACLAAGFPFVFGFTVYSGFMTSDVAESGVLNLPAADEALEGGHAVMAVGYDDASARFLVRNSWGENWGQRGYFTMPYAYVFNSDLADDFWTVRSVR